jgi:hypothetical protein
MKPEESRKDTRPLTDGGELGADELDRVTGGEGRPYCYLKYKLDRAPVAPSWTQTPTAE